jgi:hypothetical protein
LSAMVKCSIGNIDGGLDRGHLLTYS